uniref:Uncharacterized protein n=1 Tax=Nelumbo nucifera TaxID=4432 RepID=A0A822Y4S6_NELNU|nr:TPA_asm: hypothetical protein HUJ06_028915 [Nelumbo nucifera]
MAAGGLVLVAAVTYFTLYAKKKPEASAVDVAKVAAGKVDPATTQQRR